MLNLLLSFLLLLAPMAHAQTAADAQAQIDQSNTEIAKLQQEILQLTNQLNATTQQKQTLQNTVATFNLNIKKTSTSISLTNAQITQKDKEISSLSGNISSTVSEMDSVKTEIGDSLRQLDMWDNEPIVLTLLGGGTLSSFFDEATTLSALRLGLYNKVVQLSGLKQNLTTTKSAAEQKREDLASLQQKLAQQQKTLAIARDTQNQLLQQTKNQESTYQSLIAQKRAQQAKFEQDLLNYQAQLNLKVNKGALPASGSAPLSWPLDSVHITQYFGNTPFATANPQIYNGNGHSGVDFAASPGTPIKAARAGVVLGSGNTDLTCPNASFGKWIFIQHDDGLSTLYAHLSVIGVTKGQTVATGEVIGYSDTTGYATGPHLHFGVYASSGSEIASFASKGCPGRTYTMPVGDLSAYLNPLSYLPTL